MRLSISLTIGVILLFGMLPNSMAAETIRYTLAQPGTVSLGIYNEQEQLVRSLLNATAQPAGTHNCEWDGLDATGKPAPPGTYRWKLVSGPGIKAEYLFSLGTSMGINHWIGQHGGPTVVAVDGQSIIVGGSPEGSPMLCSIDMDGTYQWPGAQAEPGKGVSDIAVANGTLYALSESGNVFRYRLRDGQREQAGISPWWPAGTLPDMVSTKKEESYTFDVPAGAYLLRMTAGQADAPTPKLWVRCGNQSEEFPALPARQSAERVVPRLWGANHPYNVRPGARLPLTVSAENAQPWKLSNIGLFEPAARLDVRNEEMVATYPTAGVVAWIDPNSGKVLRHVAVAQPRDVALIAPGTALVLSGDRLLVVRANTPTPQTRITGLIEPQYLAVDAKNGDIFIVQGGASQQVVKYTRNYAHVKTYGRAGGRRSGLYVSEDFLAVAGIAADGQGGFVVVEANSAPRRTAHFAGDGTLLKEWYGGQQFYTFAAPEPEHPDLIWMDSQWGWIMQAQVDWERRTWKVRACYPWASQLDGRMGSSFKMAARMYPINLDANGDGKKETYLWFQHLSGLLMRVDEAAGCMVPAAMLTNLSSHALTKTVATGIPKSTNAWTIQGKLSMGAPTAGSNDTLEVLDSEKRPIAIFEYFRGDAHGDGSTTQSGHTNYLLCNNREISHAGAANWPNPQARDGLPFSLTLQDGSLHWRVGALTGETPPLRNSQAQAPATLRMCSRNDGTIQVADVRVSTGAGASATERFLEVAAVPWIPEPASWGQAMREAGIDVESVTARARHAAFGWTDANLDGIMQPQEFTLTDTPRGGRGNSSWIDPATFTLYATQSANGTVTFSKREPARRAANGLPVWDWAVAPAVGSGTPGGESRMVRADRSGQVYQVVAGGGDGYAAGSFDTFHSHGASWPGTMNDSAGVVKYDATGRLLWRGGAKATSFTPLRGKTHYPIAIAGFAKKDSIVGISDYYVDPCHFWTSDGLYLGRLLDGRVDDGLPKRVYVWWRADRNRGDEFDNLALFQYDMLVGGSLFELPNADVIYMGAGWNNLPCYRVHGLDQLTRQQGTLQLAAPAPAAAAQGTGLTARFYRRATPAGDADLTQTTATVWFQPGDVRHAWPVALQGVDDFSVELTGAVEPRFSEEYLFSLYERGAARLWLDDKLIIDSWENTKANQKAVSAPVPLQAGKRYTIRIAYRTARQSRPELHLNWESATQEIQHIPATALYP